MALFCAFWLACRRVFGSAKLFVTLVLEPHGVIPCFVDAFWVPCRRVLGSRNLLAQVVLEPLALFCAFWLACRCVFGSTKLLAQLALEPHGSILCFLAGLPACLWQCKVVGAIGT